MGQCHSECLSVLCDFSLVCLRTQINRDVPDIVDNISFDCEGRILIVRATRSIIDGERRWAIKACRPVELSREQTVVNWRVEDSCESVSLVRFCVSTTTAHDID